MPTHQRVEAQTLWAILEIQHRLHVFGLWKGTELQLYIVLHIQHTIKNMLCPLVFIK